MNLFSEIWIDPMNHVMEMGIILAVFIILAVYLWYMSAKKKTVMKDSKLKRQVCGNLTT